MELSTLIGLVLAASSSLIVGYIMSAFALLVSLVCRRELVVSRDAVRVMDQLFAKHGWTQTRHLDADNLPSEGLHVMMTRRGLVIGNRKTDHFPQGGKQDKYELYIFGHAVYAHIRAILTGNKDTIIVTYCESPTLWRGERSATPYMMGQQEPVGWQIVCIQDILSQFKLAKRASFILWGEPGTGKSYVAMLLNKALINGYDPVTVVANPTNRGLSISDIVFPPPEGKVTIVLFNEFDKVIEHAESSVEKSSEGISIASNKTSLLNALDRINAMKGVILIATMNGNPNTLPPAYTRRGRFDACVEAKGNILNLLLYMLSCVWPSVLSDGSRRSRASCIPHNVWC